MSHVDHPNLKAISELLRERSVLDSSRTERRPYTRAVVDLVADILKNAATYDVYSHETIDGHAEKFHDLSEQMRFKDKDYVRVRILTQYVVADKGEKWLSIDEVGELRGASVHMCASHNSRHFWVPSWSLNATELYRSNDGYANLPLRVFLKKMAHVEETKEKFDPEEAARQKAELAAKAKKLKQRTAVRNRAKGKNEYKPRNRDKRLMKR